MAIHGPRKEQGEGGFTLTQDQIKNWRTILKMPPFNIIYATNERLIPDEEIIKVAEAMQHYWSRSK